MTDAVALAKSVLAAEGQPFVTLSLAQGLPPVTAATSVADARRNYMRLAGAIHPDRIQSSFDQATEAFQCLVRAFECFADPKARKRASMQGGKRTKKPSQTKNSAAAKSQDTTTATGRKQRKAKAAKKEQEEKASESDADDSFVEEDNDDSDASAADEEEDEDTWEVWVAGDAEPTVSTNRTPIGQPRTGGIYHQTVVGCPKCRSTWEPDSRPQYSLFMGDWGKQVHCQLCLFQFGSATAIHSCPHCSAAFDYDVSMYDETQKCMKCKKEFGFAYYPVSQHLIDQIALDEWREKREREKASEREARARSRHGTIAAGEDDEATQMLIGTCVVEEECPLCHQRVKSKHRAHVLECQAKSPEERTASRPQRSRAVSTVAPKVARKPSTKVSAKASPKGASKEASPKKASPKKASPKKAAPAKRKRRRGGSSSESSESESEDSEESEEEWSSEESLSDDEDSD